MNKWFDAFLGFVYGGCTSLYGTVYVIVNGDGQISIFKSAVNQSYFCHSSSSSSSSWRAMATNLTSSSASSSSSSSWPAMSSIAAGLWNSSTSQLQIQFWIDPEHSGWLLKQGEYIKTWRRRWFVLKQGMLFWFKDHHVCRDSRPRGVIPVTSCRTVRGAADVLHKQHAFQLTTHKETMYFIADSDKEKEDWINSVGRSIIRHSRSVTESEVVDYDSKI